MPNGATWTLHGLTSNERCLTRLEKTSLVAAQPGLGRSEASCAALIPISKNDESWALTQDERRQIYWADSYDAIIFYREVTPLAR